MSRQPRILSFSGSSRKDSFNSKLLLLVEQSIRSTEATLTHVNLADFPLPLYNGDLEANEGLPANGRALKDLFLAHDALLITSPEYNGSITPLLKNTIDWVSRPVKGAPPLECFVGKVAAILAASPAWRGGLRGLMHIRDILGYLGVIVLTDEIVVPAANTQFTPEGSLIDERRLKAVQDIGLKLVTTTLKLSESST